MGRVSEPSNKRKTTATSPARPKKMKGVSAEVDRDPELVTRFLVGLVVLANLPFSTIDNIVFRSFIMYLIPWYKMPSRRTVIKQSML